MPDKSDRLRKILEIIESRPIETQGDLTEALRESGYPATQATVSRDVKELHLVKRKDADGHLRYSAFSEENEKTRNKFIRVIRDAVVSMDQAGNILVIKTISGMAMAVAAAIDSMKFEDVVGCIAGDDTIFVAVRTTQDTAMLIEKLTALIGGQNKT